MRKAGVFNVLLNKPIQNTLSRSSFWLVTAHSQQQGKLCQTKRLDRTVSCFNLHYLVFVLTVRLRFLFTVTTIDCPVPINLSWR